MSKKSSSYKLNFKNSTVHILINAFRLSENRLSSTDILNFENKTLFYQLKKNGYLKETHKGSGIYRTTSKLRKEVSKYETTKNPFGNSCSYNHSKAITKNLSFLPKEILSDSSLIKSGEKLTIEYNKIKSTLQFHKKHQKLLTETKLAILHCQEIEKNLLSTSSTYQQDFIKNRQELETYKKSLSILKGKKPASTPDYSVKLTKSQAEQVVIKYQDYLNSLGNSRQDKTERFLYENSILTMKEIITQATTETVEFTFEVITTHYDSLDIERHQNYTRLTGTPIIFVK